MKRIKQIDWWVQVGMLTAIWIIFIFHPDLLLTGYTVLAGWQVSGMIYHEVKGCYTGKSMPRFYYHRTALILLIVSMFLLPSQPHFTSVLLIVVPVLSLFYTVICYKETYRYMIRPLDLI
ncbi:hypothetical protein EXU57_18245 [Segetibacter sp. 3557_3]|uniref:hypothetical protein n=1 Tax=Segetibacter sp. 3557_3 TaxID=2547429 RepID=UPI001058E377|nr:hypothetical protein [Segetibacter sp. 3557_3]TDH23004.1 hypothetical protein EXU57_18245 [Segetibacter sp. 3557_3]